MDNKSIIQKQIIDSLEPNPHGLLLIAPRVGKTKLAIELIKRDKPKKILWVTPSSQLRDVDIPNEFIKWRAKTYLKRTDIICYASMSKHKGNYDLIIFDEFQDITEINTRPLFCNKITFKNIIGLSGTLPKKREKLQLFKDLKLNILVDLDIETAVQNSIIADYQITTIGMPLNPIDNYILAGNKERPFYQTELQYYNYYTKRIEQYKAEGRIIPMYLGIGRMKLIHNSKTKNFFAKKLLGQLKGRTLVFTSNIENAKFLSQYNYHSKASKKDLEAFINEEINELVCVNAGGTGFTYRNVDNIIIVQCDSNNKGNTVQKIARGLVLQEGYKANIYILYYRNTVDEEWMRKSLLDFNPEKIINTNIEEYEKT